ncbi:hypothetical protein [Burkholderia multivorans]|uniref:hypothetical protein n=1 Tax=Burkholderia multivorans TaxID=87883 RepID=UPI001C258539|nr:hypothetical protein [Burkholderia multivorans]MBU9552609.1 hypothetical protein [Burkholderia multivorans]
MLQDLHAFPDLYSLLSRLVGGMNRTEGRHKGFAIVSTDPEVERRFYDRMTAAGLTVGRSVTCGEATVSKVFRSIAKEGAYANRSYNVYFNRQGNGFFSKIGAHYQNIFGFRHYIKLHIIGSQDYVDSQSNYVQYLVDKEKARRDGYVYKMQQTNLADTKEFLVEGPIDMAAQYFSRHSIPATPHRLDPMKDVASFPMLMAAHVISQKNQDVEYWSRVPVPIDPESKLYNPILTWIASSIPWAVAGGLLKLAPSAELLVAMILTIPLCSFFILKSLADPVRNFNSSRYKQALLRDGGRFAFTRFLGIWHGVQAKDVTLDMVKKMANDYEIILSRVNFLRDTYSDKGILRASIESRLDELTRDHESEPYIEIATRIAPALIFQYALAIENREEIGDELIYDFYSASIASSENQIPELVPLIPHSPGQVPTINPGSGLPTLAGAGTVDIAGNNWGHGPGVGEINPGSGLPTVAGPGSIDVAGNSWGSGF